MRSTCLSVINKRKWYYIKYINTAYRLTGYITILISTLFLNCSITPLYYVMPAEFGMCWSHSRNLSSRGCGWLLSTTTVLVYCCSLVVVFFFLIFNCFSFCQAGSVCLLSYCGYMIQAINVLLVTSTMYFLELIDRLYVILWTHIVKYIG